MTAKTDAKAITPTVTAQSAAVKAGTNNAALMQHLLLKLDEVQILVRQIIALTPAADPNLTALNALLAELL